MPKILINLRICKISTVKFESQNSKNSRPRQSQKLKKIVFFIFFKSLPAEIFRIKKPSAKVKILNLINYSAVWYWIFWSGSMLYINLCAEFHGSQQLNQWGREHFHGIYVCLLPSLCDFKFHMECVQYLDLHFIPNDLRWHHGVYRPPSDTNSNFESLIAKIASDGTFFYQVVNPPLETLLLFFPFFFWWWRQRTTNLWIIYKSELQKRPKTFPANYGFLQEREERELSFLKVFKTRKKTIGKTQNAA